MNTTSDDYSLRLCEGLFRQSATTILEVGKWSKTTNEDDNLDAQEQTTTGTRPYYFVVMYTTGTAHTTWLRQARPIQQRHHLTTSTSRITNDRLRSKTFKSNMEQLS
eukprot:4875616-Amphidinium_carterae.1